MIMEGDNTMLISGRIKLKDKNPCPLKTLINYLSQHCCIKYTKLIKYVSY